MFPVLSSTTLVNLALSVGNYFISRRLFYICLGFYFLSMSSCCKSLLERGGAVARLMMCLQPFLNPRKNQQDYVLSVIVSVFWALVCRCGEGLVSGFPAFSKFDVGSDLRRSTLIRKCDNDDSLFAIIEHVYDRQKPLRCLTYTSPRCLWGIVIG